MDLVTFSLPPPQIDSMVDISSSYYSQLQLIEGTTNANVKISAETSDQKPVSEFV